MDALKQIKNGILDENPTFIQAVGMCPLLAVTTKAENALGMGIITMIIMAISTMTISFVRNIIPANVRIPCFVVIIAAFVTAIEFILAGFFHDLNNALGIFIPLIVVNCTIMARAESFASKNKPWLSFCDGIGMGLGFTAALLAVSIVREILGKGMLFGISVLPDFYPEMTIMVLAPGAFITLGVLMALINHLRHRTKKKVKNPAKGVVVGI